MSFLLVSVDVCHAEECDHTVGGAHQEDDENIQHGLAHRIAQPVGGDIMNLRMWYTSEYRVR